MDSETEIALLNGRVSSLEGEAAETKKEFTESVRCMTELNLTMCEFTTHMKHAIKGQERINDGLAEAVARVEDAQKLANRERKAAQVVADKERGDLAKVSNVNAANIWWLNRWCAAQGGAIAIIGGFVAKYYPF